MRKNTVNIPDDLVTIDEVAAMTSLSRTYLYHIYKAELPHYVFGNSPRFSRKDVLDWIMSKRKASGAEVRRDAATYCATH